MLSWYTIDFKSSSWVLFESSITMWTVCSARFQFLLWKCVGDKCQIFGTELVRAGHQHPLSINIGVVHGAPTSKRCNQDLILSPTSKNCRRLEVFQHYDIIKIVESITESMSFSMMVDSVFDSRLVPVEMDQLRWPLILIMLFRRNLKWIELNRVEIITNKKVQKVQIYK